MAEWESWDHPWSVEKISLLVNGEHLRSYEGTDGRSHQIEVSSDGYYGLRARAVDWGDYDAVLDCIQLDNVISEHIDDDRVAAALTLRLAGWRPEAIGGVLRTSKPASKLIAEGILNVFAGERRKAYERKAAKDA